MKRKKQAQVTVDIDPTLLVDAIRKGAMPGDIDGSSFTPTPASTTPPAPVEVHQPEHPQEYGGPWGTFWHPSYGWMPGHLRHRLKPHHHHHRGAADSDWDVEEVTGIGRPSSVACPEHGSQPVTRAWVEHGPRGKRREKVTLACGHTLQSGNDGLSIVSAHHESHLIEAHDSGDNETVYHCPFCGSGAVLGRSDGSAECEFCGNVFTVQVQPKHPNMPQTINGQPMQIPGMPGGPHQPPWQGQPDGSYIAPGSDGQDPVAAGEQHEMDDALIPDFLRTSSHVGVFEEALPDDAVKIRTLGPNEVWETDGWQYLVQPGTHKVVNVTKKTSSYYATEDGIALSEDQFMKRVALTYADDPVEVIEEIRSA